MKFSRRFSTPASEAETYFGPVAFWGELHALFESVPPPREHLEWDEWDRFWEIAQRHSMMNYVPRADGFDPRDGEAEVWAYGAIGMGLSRQFLRVKRAREEGISAYQFHLREKKIIDADQRRRAAQIEAERQYAVDRRKREEEAKKNRGTIQHFKPRAVHDDEVMV